MKFVKFFSLIICAALGVGLFSSCKDNNIKSDKPIVAVSIVPQEAFVRAVCGDFFDIVTMVPPGSSPENYTPTPQQNIKFAEAEIYFSIGVPIEKYNIMPNVTEKTKVVHLETEVAKVYPDLNIGQSRDPHIWLSPKRAIVMVNIIQEQLSLLYPEQKDIFKQNAENYIAQISQVDGEIRAVLGNLENKNFIVFHPAFGYLADEYGLIMFSLEEEGKEATPQHLQEMIDLAKSQNIKVIFYQAEIDASQSRAYAEEIGGRAALLEPLSYDYVDNLRVMAQTLASLSE